MSAIAVLWAWNGDRSVARLQASMLNAQARYGPDFSGSWSDASIALGLARMNVLPEDSFDRQPLWSADGSMCLVADLRLDNRDDLARELDLAHPEELSDSGILLAAWIRWGPDCLSHLVGAFAFAVWSPARRELFAVCDHTGDRSIFFHSGDALFALTTMPQGLAAVPGIIAGFNQRRVADWLSLNDWDWRTSYFAGIERLPAGHMLTVTPAGCQVRQYWKPTDAKPVRFRRDEEYAEALAELMDRATDARLRGGKIGAQLSSGLDSSAVSATAAGLMKRRGERLTCFTSVPRPGFDPTLYPSRITVERDGAAAVARAYANVDHIVVDSSGYDLMTTMRRWVDAMGEPILNAVNILWLSAIFDRARDCGIKIMLDGQSGNRTISWMSQNVFGEYLRSGRWGELLRTAWAVRRNGGTSVRGAIGGALHGSVPSWLASRVTHPVQTFDFTRCAIHPALAAKYGSLATDERSEVLGLDPMSARMQMFQDADDASLRQTVAALWGIDLRDPTDDRRIWEFCFAIPPEQFVVGGHSRSLVRRAMHGRVPDAVRLSYARGLQGADWWMPVGDALPAMRDELALLEQSPAASAMVDLPKLKSLLAKWPTSGYERADITQSWNYSLSRGLTMGYFLRSWEARF